MDLVRHNEIRFRICLTPSSFLLVRRPDVMQKLRIEIGGMCTLDFALNRRRLKKMHYLLGRPLCLLLNTFSYATVSPLYQSTLVQHMGLITTLPVGGGVIENFLSLFQKVLLYSSPRMYYTDGQISTVWMLLYFDRKDGRK